MSHTDLNKWNLKKSVYFVKYGKIRKFKLKEKKEKNQKKQFSSDIISEGKLQPTWTIFFSKWRAEKMTKGNFLLARMDWIMFYHFGFRENSFWHTKNWTPFVYTIMVLISRHRLHNNWLWYWGISISWGLFN